MKEIYANKHFRCYLYSGAIHIHTSQSDGSKTLREVINIAHRTSLDYAIFTDHNVSDKVLQSPSFPQKEKQLRILLCTELNDGQNQNHILALGVKKQIPPAQPAQQNLAAIQALGGYSFVAHPGEERVSRKYRPYPWTHWNCHDFDGIEIWNSMSEWMEEMVKSVPAWLYLFPRKAMVGPKPKILAWWDQLNQQGMRKTAIGGIDVHATKHSLANLLDITVFPYKTMFNWVRTNLLLHRPLSEEPAMFEQEIYEALKRGNTYICNYAFGEPENFLFYLENSPEEVALPGDDFALSSNSFLSIRLPQKERCRVIINGQMQRELITDHYQMPVSEPGFYRLEVWKKNRPWIFTNPIWAE